MSLSLKSLRYFIAVAEVGSISAAVQSLHISQSAVTEAIKALEHEVGAALFQRHARGMVLTHPGNQFLRHAYEILAAVRNAREALAARPDTMSGALHVGVTALVTGYFLPYLLDRYHRVFPQVEVRVHEDSRDYVEHLLLNGELDVAVIVITNLANAQAFETEALVRSPWSVWLPPNHPRLAQASVALADLADDALITLNVDELEALSTAALRAAGRREPPKLRTASVEAIRSLVATGAGVSLMPDMIYRPWSLEGDRLEARPLAEEMPRLEVGLAWRRGSPLSDAARQFVMLAREFGRRHAR